MAFVSPWLAGFLAFMALPIGLSLYYSFTDYSMLEPPVYVGTSNYARLATDPVFHQVLKNTLFYAGVSIPLGTIVALLVGWMLHQRAHGRSLFRAAVFVPTLVPATATAMIWLWLFNGELGLINRAIDAVGAPIGVRGPNWLGDRNWAMYAMILMSVWGVGQAVVIYLAAFQDVPVSLYEAADIDGLSGWRKFTSITLPMVSPVILYNVIVGIIGTWQVFVIPYIMTSGGPDRATYFYSMYLYDSAFKFLNMGYASAMAWVQLLIILLLTGLTFLVSRRLVFYRAA